MTVTAQSVQTERIRGPHLAVLVKRAGGGVPFEEGLRKANDAGVVIASNKRLNMALESDEWQRVRDVFACWTGTMTAYTKPGERLGKQVEYVDSKTGYRWVFAVPEAHRDKKDAILVAEHPGYNLEVDGNNRVIHTDAANVGLVEKFPAFDGWYLGDPKYDIPNGDQVSFSDKARHLWRTDQRVGPVRRGSFFGYDGRLGVGLNESPSVGLGVAVEAASGGAPAATVSV